MNLIFEQVQADQDDRIAKIYEILKVTGEDMFLKQGLVHWKRPYPFEAIKKNCEERIVFLVRNNENNDYVHTFQLEYKTITTSGETAGKMKQSETKFKVAIINKLATVPHASGRGVGNKSMDYIECFCRNSGISKLCLDVYDQSAIAIQFYKNRGFVVVGTKPTKHFNVYLMEKKL